MNDNYELILNEQYNKNLSLFKKNQYDTYLLLTTTQDTSYSLEINNDTINIAQNNQILYPYSDPLEYTQLLFEGYKNRGKLNLIEYDIDTTKEDDSLTRVGIPTLSGEVNHLIIEKYYEKFNQYPDCSKLNPYHNEINNMIIFGIGFGYHIPWLIDEYKINTLILVETNIEMLRASLYLLNWESIFNYFNNDIQKRSLEIIISDNSESLKHNLLISLTEKHPLACYNLAQFTLLQNHIIEDTIQKLLYSLKLSVGANFGYFDDEKWSIQHTLHNINNHIPILRSSGYQIDKDTKVFLVANGPSLDEYIDIIKKYKDKAIIIACGTAFASLYKYGIIADILIEIERTIVKYDAIIEYAPIDILENVMFVGMNNMHPRVFSLFKKSYIFLKYNDSGVALINDKRFPQLSHVNPSVSNAALRLALFFNFENISLFGMDFGFQSKNNHHSSQSIYNDSTSKFYTSEYDDLIEVEDINGNLIYTREIYNNSKKNIEAITELAASQYDIKIYNFSKGAKIKSTIVANNDYEYLTNAQKLTLTEKQHILNTISKKFIPYEKKIQLEKDLILVSLKKLINLLENIKSKDINAFNFLKNTNYFWKYYNKEFENTPLYKTLIKGTLLQLLSKTYVYVSFQEQNKLTSEFINNSIDITIQYLISIEKTIINLENYIDSPFK